MRKLYRWDNKEVELVHETTGKVFKEGDAVTSFRGEPDVIRYIEPPHKSSASGRVNNYYAGVYDLKFQLVGVKETPQISDSPKELADNVYFEFDEGTISAYEAIDRLKKITKNL